MILFFIAIKTAKTDREPDIMKAIYLLASIIVVGKCAEGPKSALKNTFLESFKLTPLLFIVTALSVLVTLVLY